MLAEDQSLGIQPPTPEQAPGQQGQQHPAKLLCEVATMPAEYGGKRIEANAFFRFLVSGLCHTGQGSV
jgi:hypothetical protein